MLINDIRCDVKARCAQKGYTLADFCGNVGKSRQTFNAFLNGNIVNPKFIEVMDKLGYDVKIEYISKGL